MKNTIYLRRKSKLIIKTGNDQLPTTHLATILKNLEAFGYTLSQTAITQVQTLSKEAAKQLYKQLVKDIKEMTGAKRKFKPMYPNFPKQVMEASEVELYINAILHYVTRGKYMPAYETEAREPLLEKTDLRIIDLGDEADFRLMFTQLMSANASISATDKEDLDWVVRQYRDDVAQMLPEAIPMKENLAYVTGLLLKHTSKSDALLKNYYKTATDVLRLAVSLSDGDVSLAEVTRFRNFKRGERKLLVGLLEKAGNITEDMLRYKSRWIRLGEKLHPFEYKKRFPKVYKAFDVIRNDQTFHTFNSQVEQSLANLEIFKATALLKNRSGEFARRLDHLLRMATSTEEWQYVTQEFAEVVHKVSTPVLLQVRAHFNHRDDSSELRTFFPKGNVAKVQAIPNQLPEIPVEACLQVINLCETALVERFKELKPLGKVYIDERLKNYLVPFSQRSASKALRTIVRGSKVSMPKGGDTIRFFIWWKEGVLNGRHTGTVDIDLSAVMYDSNWNYLEHISYTNLKSARYRAAHSGDIVSAPQGACEFIDLDIPSIIKYGGRYVVMNIYSYSYQPFCDLPECYGGWMMRQSPQSGEIFDARTVQDKVDVTADTRICIPVIMDLHTRKVVWSDLALRSNPRWHNNVEGNMGGMTLMGKAMTTLKKPNLYDLFMLHAQARGELVYQNDRNEAEVVFTPEEGITPFDIELIMAEYM
ncbi:MAG TPA: cytoplasmic protein [Microscillaceae bacterium]|nr:cytoplasmic protein [Microscillaceae bacterium]